MHRYHDHEFFFSGNQGWIQPSLTTADVLHHVRSWLMRFEVVFGALQWPARCTKVSYPRILPAESVYHDLGQAFESIGQLPGRQSCLLWMYKLYVVYIAFSANLSLGLNVPKPSLSP